MTRDQPVRPGSAWPDLLGGLGVIGGMMLMLVTLPVTLPIALVFDWNGRRRLRAAARATLCGRCGTLLGPDAPAASDTAHMAELVEAQRRHPLHHVHVARRAQARCRACGADHVWDEKRRTLHLLVDSARDHREQRAGIELAEVDPVPGAPSLPAATEFRLDRAVRPAAVPPPVPPIASVAGDSDLAVTVVMTVRPAPPE